MRSFVASRYYVRNEVQGSSAATVVMEGYRATNNAAYTAVNEGVIASLTQQAAASGGTITIEGDLQSVLTIPGTVVISDSIYNTQCFTLQPGDKIQLALFASRSRKIDENLTREKDVLRQQLKWYNFDYVELTVGAGRAWPAVRAKYSAGPVRKRLRLHSRHYAHDYAA